MYICVCIISKFAHDIVYSFRQLYKAALRITKYCVCNIVKIIISNISRVALYKYVTKYINAPTVITKHTKPLLFFIIIDLRKCMH